MQNFLRSGCLFGGGCASRLSDPGVKITLDGQGGFIGRWRECPAFAQRVLRRLQTGSGMIDAQFIQMGSM